ncbi:unnamed protein product, partial [Symbiodinium pilosum]
RMLATVLTTLAPYFTNDKRLRLMNRLNVSTISMPSPTNKDQLTTSPKGDLKEEMGIQNNEKEEKEEEANTPSTGVVENDVPADLRPMNRRWEEKLQTVDV